MTLTVHLPEEVAARLAAEATRRGITVDDLVAEMVARLPSEPASANAGDEDALEAFIGSGASGRTERFDIHDARAELAARKLAEGA